MAIYDAASCTCWNTWMSVTAPPPCPIHYRSNVADVVIGPRGMPCRGRHCKHNDQCRNWVGDVSLIDFDDTALPRVRMVPVSEDGFDW